MKFTPVAQTVPYFSRIKGRTFGKVIDGRFRTVLLRIPGRCFFVFFGLPDFCRGLRNQLRLGLCKRWKMKKKCRECRLFGGGSSQPLLDLKTVMAFLAALFHIKRFCRFDCLLLCSSSAALSAAAVYRKMKKKKLDNSVRRCYHNKAFRKRASGGIGRLARFRF